MGVETKITVTKDLKIRLGQRVKFFRKKRSLSQEQLAEMINMETKSLSRIESGHNYPMYENLVLISSALEIEPWQLYFTDEIKNLDMMKDEIISALEKDETKIPAVYQYLATLK